MRELYEHQKEAFEKAKDLDYAMLNMACGTGKTATAIHLAVHKGRNTLIITPKAVLSSWKDELIEEGIPEEDIWVYTAEDKRETGEEKYLEQLKAFLLEGRDL